MQDFWRQIVQGKNMNCAGILGVGGSLGVLVMQIRNL